MLNIKRSGVRSAEEVVETGGSAQFLAAGQCIVISGFSNVSHTDLQLHVSVTAPSCSVSPAEKHSVVISSMSKNISSFSLMINGETL